MAKKILLVVLIVAALGVAAFMTFSYLNPKDGGQQALNAENANVRIDKTENSAGGIESNLISTTDNQVADENQNQPAKTETTTTTVNEPVTTPEPTPTPAPQPTVTTQPEQPVVTTPPAVTTQPVATVIDAPVDVEYAGTAQRNKFIPKEGTDPVQSSTRVTSE